MIFVFIRRMVQGVEGTFLLRKVRSLLLDLWPLLMKRFVQKHLKLHLHFFPILFFHFLITYSGYMELNENLKKCRVTLCFEAHPC